MPLLPYRASRKAQCGACSSPFQLSAKVSKLCYTLYRLGRKPCIARRLCQCFGRYTCVTHIHRHTKNMAYQASKQAKYCLVSLVLIMPAIRKIGRSRFSSKLASTSATASPAWGLWPPSSQSSEPWAQDLVMRRDPNAAFGPAMRSFA